MTGVCAVLGAALAMTAHAQKPTVLDRVVAVVNNRAILESDLQTEVRLAVLEPASRANGGQETPQEALQRLISRTLIRQQIRQEEAQATTPTTAEVENRLTELRKELPVCARENCATDEGWATFLAKHDLTDRQVRIYLRNRLEILRFIEMRFRQGIRISQRAVQDYYTETLLPQYLPGQTAPPLDQVAPRIEEILLQQQVNALFSDWLDNLRKQGEVEVLDPTLEASDAPASGGAQ
ncbi:MAG TPA: hypothetical protein VG893_14960 [Terracidiphilus sp.]|nr:hypothetical protein [Terracidiphilus sp.]